MKKYLYPLLSLLLLFVTACRGDEEIVVPHTSEEIGAKGSSFYLLNEGNMGSNKASIDYYDAKTGTYRRNLFAEANPSVVFELGDVGNDLQVYGSRLYAVINVSNLIEVMDARTLRHLGQIPLPNCRNIVFRDGYAYATSYAGPVATDPNARLGYVARIDTATMRVVDTCVVGYQPEQMVMWENRLYVANSGGYRAPNYDRTVSVIDLTTFREIQKIDVAPNLNAMVLAGGKIYVQSRGDYGALKPNVYVLNPQSNTVEGALNVEALNLCADNHLLYFLTEKEVVISNGQRLRLRMQHPYGIAAREGFIYVTDARDYVSPGRVYCFNAAGEEQWSTMTGDIPAHFAFVTANPQTNPTPQPQDKAVISAILKYLPAPGQFVNTLPAYTPGDTQESMNAKVLAAVGNGGTGMVTLGAFGGTLEFALSRPLTNVEGAYDFRLRGNAFPNGSEAGVVSVAYDANGNGRPDPTEWYELAGSAHAQSTPNYTITYTRPAAGHLPTPGSGTEITDTRYIAWEDNQGGTGFIEKNSYHTQDYFPAWVTDDRLTFTARRLPDNARLNGSIWESPAFEYGYVDNHPNASDGSLFKIEWAVDAAGRHVALPAIHFIRITTGLRQQLGRIGESSTEFTGFDALH